MSESEKKFLIYDYQKARPAIEAMGVARDMVDHYVDVANDLARYIAKSVDVFIAARVETGRCMHLESICLAAALVTEKLIPMRAKENGGDEVLDPVACIEAVRKMVEISPELEAKLRETPEDSDDDDDDDDDDDEDDGEETPMVH